MDKKKRRSGSSIIFFIFTFLMIFVCILLFGFGRASYISATQLVQSEMLNSAQDFSQQVQDELEKMTHMGIAFSDVVEGMPIDQSANIVQVINKLYDNSDAYMVVYCDKNGIGVTQDNIKIDVTLDHILLKDFASEQYYEYIKLESLIKDEAIISVIPTKKIQGDNGYILMYYSVNRIKNNFKNNPNFKHGFMIFSGIGGTVITTEGIETNENEISLPKFILSLDRRAKRDNIDMAMKYQLSLVDIINIDGKDRCVIYSPIGIEDWLITTGFDSETYKERIRFQWIHMRNLIIYLSIIIFVFISVSIIYIIITRISYAKNNKRLQKEVDMDMLTGLYNKMATEREIETFIVENTGQHLIFFLLDVDDFKGINDKQGHLVGDEVLKNIGEFIRQQFRETDILGRIGGDEFVILMKDFNSTNEINSRIEQVELAFHKFSVSISIGTAIYPENGSTFIELYKAADRAMYEAKVSGKNKLVQS